MDEQTGLYRKAFDSIKCPLILCDAHGGHCDLNREARILFSRNTIRSLGEIFPDFPTPSEEEGIVHRDTWGRENIVHTRKLGDDDHFILSFADNHSDWEDFVREQKILNQIYIDLCTCTSEKEIYRKVVENGINRLKIDRIGILLVSREGKRIQGSWGTDPEGNIIDQSYYESDLEKEKWALDTIDNRDYVMVRFDSELKNEGEIIGTGWNSLAAFFDADEPIGWIACDNLLTHSPLPRWKQEILGELARMVGRFVSRFRMESNLQNLVEKKTEQLRLSQKSLVEAEKMASLGSLVAGVSHEINTPLGTAITANSFLMDLVEETVLSFKSGTLKKSQLEEFLTKIHDSRELISSSLEKASEHINNFKKLAVKTTAESSSVFTLRDCIDTVVRLSFSDSRYNVKVENSIDSSLKIRANQNDFIQIFKNLLDNSIKHGFQNNREGTIGIRTLLTQDNLIIEYWDNGVELKEEVLKKLFEPFFTTGRHLGQAGLGLSIIHNLVYMYKGIIEVHSNNPGLLFRLSFPRLDRQISGPY